VTFKRNVSYFQTSILNNSQNKDNFGLLIIKVRKINKDIIPYLTNKTTRTYLTNKR
jgi:hypothetical protein